MSRRRSAVGQTVAWFGLGVAILAAATYFVQHTPTMAVFDPRPVGLAGTLFGTGLALGGLVLARTAPNGGRRGSRLAVPASLSAALAVLYVAFTYLAYHQEPVHFASDDVVLSGTLLLPRGAGPHPAVVMMHGAGEAVRMGNFAEAQSLARHGVAALIYDKRGSGRSAGGHYRYDGYAALAADGVAAVRLLRARPDIDANGVGLWGTSEGGWTAVLAASDLDDLAFMVIVSGPGTLTVAQQGAHSLAERLRMRGVAAADIARALQLNALYDQYLLTGAGRDRLAAAIEATRDQPWAHVAFIHGLSLPEVPLSPLDTWQRDHLDFHVRPQLQRLTAPILYVLGADDPLIPALRVQRQLDGLFARAGHRDHTVEIFAGATHNLIRAAPRRCLACIHDDVIGPFRPMFVPGYLKLVARWVSERVTPAGSSSAAGAGNGTVELSPAASTDSGSGRPGPVAIAGNGIAELSPAADAPPPPAPATAKALAR